MGSLEIEPFQTTFAVPLHCPACIEAVVAAVTPVPGVHSITGDLQSQIVQVTGTAAPSTVIAAIQSTGRDAVLRGSGSGGSSSAAVCILETSSPSPAGDGDAAAAADKKYRICGLARMVQIYPTTAAAAAAAATIIDNRKERERQRRPRTLVDLTLRGMQATPGTYHVTIRENGDISRGASSTGPIWEGKTNSAVVGMPNDDDANVNVNAGPRGSLGEVQVGRDGSGSAVWDVEIGVWEVIGRAMVVRKLRPDEDGAERPISKGDEVGDDEGTTLVGVIARSAGVWDNDKTVCSCSGKNVWEERREQVDRGMI